jgi:hypothetical protein
MRFPARTSILFFAFIVVAALFVGSRGTPIQAQVPAAAGAGVDPSKLPDVEGIHLGMSIENASAIMKSLFPAGSHTLTATASKFLNTADKAWITSMTGTLNNGCTGCQEQVIVKFSMPPNPQQVIDIQRAIVFETNKQPPMDATIAGLRKKYGPETIKTVPDPVQYFAWLYDEQGKLLPATPQFGRGCAGSIVGPPLGGDPGHPNSVGFALATGPVTPSSVAALMRDPCRSHVHVSAQVSPSSPTLPLVHILDIHMSENALDTRDIIAAQKYLDGVATAKKQQDLKKAQQQAAPSL